jgi:putative thioredoxin
MPALALDVDARSFEREVIEASKNAPVIVDFWAPWCAPCRVLKPILEKLATEYAGRFKLAKVNSDENVELASAFGVRSIPDVVAFRDGRPVSHFLGALPESQVRAFIERLLPSPSELERARAPGLKEAGDVAGALAALRRAVALDAANDLARLDLAELLIAQKQADEAEPLLEAIQPNAELDARVAALTQALAFARAGSAGPGEPELRSRLAANPADLEARLSLAQLYAGTRRYREAMDELLESIRRDKAYQDGAARKQVVAILNLADSQPELVSEYRRKLASALY